MMAPIEADLSMMSSHSALNIDAMLSSDLPLPSDVGNYFIISLG